MVVLSLVGLLKHHSVLEHSGQGLPWPSTYCRAFIKLVGIARRKFSCDVDNADHERYS